MSEPCSFILLSRILHVPFCQAGHVEVGECEGSDVWTLRGRSVNWCLGVTFADSRFRVDHPRWLNIRDGQVGADIVYRGADM